jgi:putative pyruvate formate lyase activating enzyme
VCKLGANAQVVEHFVHIGEEPPINPSLMISLEGCGLRCKYCQQFPLLEPGTLASEPLKAGFWGMLDARHARSMSFIGGNPDESLAGILAFLVSIPGKWKLPIVWNNHAYSTPAALRLLHGVVDAYVPDFKYANDACGLQLSGVKSYAEVAANTIRAMLGQQVPVFVRLLVLPGHLQCCHLPAVRTLSSMNSEHLFVSLRGQYSPDHGVLNCDGSDRALLQLSRRPSGYEIAEVRSAVVSSGLRLVQSGDVAEYVNTCAGSG